MSRADNSITRIALTLAGFVTLTACQADTAVAPRDLGLRSGAAAAGSVPVVTVTDLGLLPGHNSGIAMGCNSAGQVVGWSSGPGGQHAVLWQNGTITDLGTLGGRQSSAHDINASGQIVGVSEYDMASPGHHAFRWQNGTMTDLGLGWATRISNSGIWVGSHTLWNKGTATDLGSLTAWDVNSAGEVVGTFVASGKMRAGLWRKGVLTDLGTLGGSVSYAGGINSGGEVVGGSYITGDLWQHAFLWKNGTMIDLGTLGGLFSQANAISASGDVAGRSTTSSEELHAFLWEKGTMIDLGSLPGKPVAVTTCISDNGRFVAGYSKDIHQGPERPTLWTIR